LGINQYAMTSFNPDMQNEKLAAILLVIVIVGSISVFLTVTYGEDILNALNGKKTGEKVIALGDCVDVNFIGRFASNNTIFASSYNDTINKIGGTPLNLFVSTNTSESPPTGYEDYTNLIDDYYVKGLIEGLVGLKEGQEATIGPIPPEKAYGIYPKAGDNFTIPDPSSGKDIKIQFVDVTADETTTLFVVRMNYYSPGEKTTVYLSWENATVVTKINDTKVWMYTTPPEDRITNFTWMSYDPYNYITTIYPENTSSVTSINDTTIIVTHNPQINAVFLIYSEYNSYYNYYYGYDYPYPYYYTVVSLTNETINVSYVDESTGETSYYDFNRTVTIVRNESQDITETYTTPDMEYFLSEMKNYYLPDLTFSVNTLAGETLIYEVQIVKIYTSA